MSEVETDHESDRINNTGGTDNDLTTYGTISLFTSSLSNTPNREKATLIEHFENSLVKNEKALIRLKFGLNMRVIKSNIHLIWNVWKNYSI